MPSNFKDTLIRESGLLSLSQGDCDLYLIGQARTITYRQLAATGLHGKTITGGRLSIKKLEKDNYVISRFLPGCGREKYYTLTARGKKRLEKLFGKDFLQKMALQLEKKTSLSQQQLPHRIHTNDIYFAYLASHTLRGLPIWQNEVSYDSEPAVSVPPRSDGLLKTDTCIYYIEQDEGTQGDSALRTKLDRYITQSDVFLGENLKNHSLVFTLHCSPKERPVRRPPYSIYRILLKAIRVWKTLEAQAGCKLNFSGFCDLFEDRSHSCLCHLSINDRAILRNLCRQHPQLSLSEMEQLKHSFLYDSSQEDDRQTEQDSLFRKRLKTRFYALADDRANATLQHRLRQGLRLYVLPNHRLANLLPFSLQEEYHFPEQLRKILFDAGLEELSQWAYTGLGSISDGPGKKYLFRNIFRSGEDIRIIAEDISHDLGGRERVRYYLGSHERAGHILFLLLVSSRKDAGDFLESTRQIRARKENRRVSVCFMDKDAEQPPCPGNHGIYFRKETSAGSLWLPALLEYDAFLSELNLSERRI
ncbi:MAG TPA: hypothetical protein DCZ91_19655 [Lachnospiraceae bacterium]|nr:hypothetical protein [Lachnospiraceae bacterium]